MKLILPATVLFCLLFLPHCLDAQAASSHAHSAMATTTVQLIEAPSQALPLWRGYRAKKPVHPHRPLPAAHRPEFFKLPYRI